MRQLQVLLCAVIVIFARSLPAQRSSRDDEGKAFITENEARLVFPRDTISTYRWDVPAKGMYAGSPEFAWEVDWNDAGIRDGTDPYELTLLTSWKPGGPRAGPLSRLLAGRTVDPMINCTTCDLAASVDPERDTTTVFASVEDGRVVFHVKGREAVRRIFPVIPDTMTFTVRGISDKSQTVLVNCTSRARHSCVVPPRRPLPNADSAREQNTPRQVYVVVARFSDANLVPNIDVTVKTPNGAVWKTISSGPLGAFRIHQPPLGPLLLIARCPAASEHPEAVFGTEFFEIRPGLDSTVQLMTDPGLCGKPGR